MDSVWGISSIVLQIILVVTVEWRITNRLSHRWIVPVFLFMPGILGFIFLSVRARC